MLGFSQSTSVDNLIEGFAKIFINTEVGPWDHMNEYIAHNPLTVLGGTAATIAATVTFSWALRQYLKPYIMPEEFRNHELKVKIAVARIRSMADFLKFDAAFHLNHEWRMQLYTLFSEKLRLNEIKTVSVIPLDRSSMDNARNRFINKMRALQADLKYSNPTFNVSIREIIDGMLGLECGNPCLAAAFGHISTTPLSAPTKIMAFKIIAQAGISSSLAPLIATFDDSTTENEIDESFVAAAKLGRLDIASQLIHRYGAIITTTAFELAFEALIDRCIDNHFSNNDERAFAISLTQRWPKMNPLYEHIIKVVQKMRGMELHSQAQELLNETRLDHLELPTVSASRSVSAALTP